MTAPTVGRQEIIDALAQGLEPVPWIRAAWLGGSDGTGRTDEWSDVDLQILVEDAHKEEAFERVRAVLERLSPIAHSYRFPEPTWHGHSQELLSLRDADDCHFLDLVVMLASSDDRLLEPERHGEALVLFDKDGVVKPAPFDRAKHAAKMRERLPVLRELFFLLQNLVKKAVRRGAEPDAVLIYVNRTVAPLVELLRMRHCPDRYDFGLRYLDRDLPPELAAEIRAMMLPSSLEGLEACRARAEEMFRENLRAHDAGEWRLPD